MRELQPVFELTENHMTQIKELCDLLWDGTQPHHIINRYVQGEITLWRTRSDTALVLTEIQSHEAGRELFIYGIVGRDILAKRQAVGEDLQHIAKLSNCKFIGAEASSLAWKWLAKHLGFKPVSVRYIKEL